MLTSGEGLVHQRRMAVVTGCDYYGVAAWIRKQAWYIGAGVSESKLTANMYRVTPLDAVSVEASTGLCQGGDENTAGVIACTDHS